MRSLPALTLALLAALVAAAPAAADAPVFPDLDRLGERPVAIDDAPLDSSSERFRARSAARIDLPDPVRAVTGELVRVGVSARYAKRALLGRSWANFFAGLIHGPELARVVVYVAPPDEVSATCGDDSDACYSAQDNLLVIPGDTPASGVPVEEIAAHEYGHHIANSRSNYPWEAIDWGTKRWSTAQLVCQRVRAGRAFPGDQGRRYRLNPGEGFADAYRVLAGGSWSGRFDAAYKPTPADLALIRQDVLDPWRENVVEVREGSFTATGPSVQRFDFTAPLDGRLKLTLKGAREQDVDLYLYDDERRLAGADNPGRQEGLRGELCGVREFTVAVRRDQGPGRFRLEVSHP